MFNQNTKCDYNLVLPCYRCYKVCCLPFFNPVSSRNYSYLTFRKVKPKIAEVGRTYKTSIMFFFVYFLIKLPFIFLQTKLIISILDFFPVRMYGNVSLTVLTVQRTKMDVLKFL